MSVRARKTRTEARTEQRLGLYLAKLKESPLLSECAHLMVTSSTSRRPSLPAWFPVIWSLSELSLNCCHRKKNELCVHRVAGQDEKVFEKMSVCCGDCFSLRSFIRFPCLYLNWLVCQVKLRCRKEALHPTTHLLFVLKWNGSHAHVRLTIGCKGCINMLTCQT